MLLQFTIENYLSFRDKAVFSMRAASNVERDDKPPDVVRGTDILRCAAMYGANASGKSNFIKALSFAQALVVRGVSERGKIATRPFRLDPVAATKPSCFEFYLRAASGKTYGYGFEVRPDAVVREWLSELEAGEETEVFSRDGKNFEFSPALAPPEGEFLNLLSSAARDNQLLVRTAREFKLERFPQAFTDVLAWFEEALVIIAPDARLGGLVGRVAKDERFRAFLEQVLSRADTGISAVQTVRREVSKDERSMLERLASGGADEFEDGRTRAHFVTEGDDWRCEELRLRHAGDATDEAGGFELEDESDGTVRLLDLAPMLFYAGKTPLVFVVDELDRSVHTSLTRWLVERFITESAGTASQLIFTTHDTNLLDLQRLRPDSIWFSEKDEKGVSTLYSLAEFKKEQIEALCGALEQGYLNGRFGAIPFLGDAVRLGWPRGGEG